MAVLFAFCVKLKPKCLHDACNLEAEPRPQPDQPEIIGPILSDHQAALLQPVTRGCCCSVGL